MSHPHVFFKFWKWALDTLVGLNNNNRQGALTIVILERFLQACH